MVKELGPKATKPVTCRMFETPIIELFSRIHPFSPAAFWVPTLLLLLGYEHHRGVAPLRLVALVAVGWLAWSLTEYLLHRFVFHWIEGKPWDQKAWRPTVALYVQVATLHRGSPWYGVVFAR